MTMAMTIVICDSLMKQHAYEITNAVCDTLILSPTVATSVSIAESFERQEVERDETSKVIWQKEFRRLVVARELISCKEVVALVYVLHFAAMATFWTLVTGVRVDAS